MSEREERLARVGEYVLGTLDDVERAAVEREMSNDPQLRAAADRFAARLAVLNGDSQQAVPAGMWEAVRTRIIGVQQEGQAEPNITTMPYHRSWRPLALAASLLAALGLGYLTGSFTASQREPVVIVMLQTPQNTTGAVFEAFADNSVRIVPLEDFVIPEGKIMQVWTLYDKTVGPVSLGTLSRPSIVTIAGSNLPVPTADQLYEITLEQAPGSPTGKPTGPILVKGFAKAPPL